MIVGGKHHVTHFAEGQPEAQEAERLAQVTEPGLPACGSPWPRWEEREKPMQPGGLGNMKVGKDPSTYLCQPTVPWEGA